jgi:transposase InsO family protein
MPITLEDKTTSGLIDGAASACFMDEELAHDHGISLVRKTIPTEVRVIDGRKLDPILYETLPIRMTCTETGHTETLSFNIIQSPHYKVVLGLSWLKIHNPFIDWRNMTLTFRSCPTTCAFLPISTTSLTNATISALVPAEETAPVVISALPSDQSPMMDESNPVSSQWLQREDVPPEPVFDPARLLNLAKKRLQHYRLGHRNHSDVARMRTRNMVKNMDIGDDFPAETLTDISASHLSCEPCALAKGRRLPFPQRRKPHEYEVLERITVDTCGPLPVCSLNGERYFITFSDDRSRYKFTFLLKRKSEAFDAFKNLRRQLEKRVSTQIKILFGDNAGDFISNKFRTYLQNSGITWQSTVVHSSEQNGISERGHLTLMNSARAMLIHARLPKQFWGPAILTATHLHNLCPHPDKSETTPHEQLWKTKPDVCYLRVFGCDAYGLSHGQSKLDAKAKKYILIGYANHQKGYMLFDPETAKTSIHRNVQFHESCFGNRSQDDALADPLDPEHDYDSDFLAPEHDEIRDDDDNILRVADDEVMSLTAPSRTSRYRRPPDRFGEQVSTNWIYSVAPQEDFGPGVTVPRNYKNVSGSPDESFWVAATTKELDSLVNQNTFRDTFSLPDGARAISCTWIYKIKLVTELPQKHDWIIRTLKDGRVIRYKARLVVRGNHQRPGIDYNETYAPVIRGEILRLLVSLMVEDPEIIAEQMDAITAFLNGNLTEEIYMHSPEGYRSRARFVKLLKSLYGLKQAPHEWHKVIDAYLIEIGFSKIHSTTCLYINRKSTGRYVIVGIYVDDFPIIGHPELFAETKAALSARFKMSDLGPLHQFIGVQIEHNVPMGTAFLHQTKHIEHILATCHMDECRPYATPTSPDMILTKDMSPKSDHDREIVREESGHINYRMVVGLLLYLRFTRPDIAYSLSQLCKYVQDPGPQHFVALKRLLRYLQGTRTLGIVYQRRQGPPVLYGFSDSDWAGDKDTRRSTTGYEFYVNGNLISYSSKQQPSPTLSSCESEIVASSQAGAEIVWLRGLLLELGCAQSAPTDLFQDNQGSIAFGMNIVNHSKMKHIALREHFVRHLVQQGDLTSKYVPTAENVADIFTKPLNKVKFIHFRDRLNMVPRAAYDALVEGGS